MVGLELPVLAMEHQYLITEEIPEVAQSTSTEMLHVIDFEGEIYMRQEGKGMLLGTYERAGVPWSSTRRPGISAIELLPPDLDRIAPSSGGRLPAFPADRAAPASSKIINGPFTFAPDGNPLVGPVRGLANYWVACGVMAGFSQGGGVGLALANWMIEGDPGVDVWAMDVARFGDWATCAYTNAKVRENYARRFRIPFPNEELPAARPLRTTPVYDRLQGTRAPSSVLHMGWSTRCGSRPTALKPVEEVTFRRSNAHAPVAAEMPRRARRRGPARDLKLRQIRGDRAGRRGVARPHAPRQPHAAPGRIGADADAQRRRQADRRFHRSRAAGRGTFLDLRLRRRRAIPYALVRGASAADGALRSARCGASFSGFADRRAALARTAGTIDAARMSRTQAFPFLVVASPWSRAGPGDGRPHLVHAASSATRFGCAPIISSLLYDTLMEAGADLGLRHFGARALNVAAAGEELRQLGARVPADLRSVRSRPRPFRRARQGAASSARHGAPGSASRDRNGASLRSSLPRTAWTRSGTSRFSTMARQ